MSQVSVPSENVIVESPDAVGSDQETADVSFSRGSVAGGDGHSRLSLLSVVLVCVLVIVGSLALIALWIHMSRVWSTDSLRVIGAVFPLVSFLGVLSAWNRLSWRAEGSLWGLVPLALAVELVRVVTITPTYFVDQPEYWREIHAGPVLFLYGVGAVLLFGGWRLLRAAILPLCLLLCINPVPRSFNYRFDMPLQEFSAATARAFAHLIGLHPTGDQLRMMFSPDFGMMIVPGCNGVRGSITLAYLALIYGYVRNLKLRTLALVTVSALLAGYGFNLLRLCVLVVYYRIGMSMPSIQGYGAGVDYAIGGTIFLLATGGLGFLIRWLEAKQGTLQPVQAAKWPETSSGFRPILAGVVCFLIVITVGVVRTHAMVHTLFERRATEKELMQSLPKAVGSYTLVRTYSEGQYSVAGSPMLIIGDYAAPAGLDGKVGRMTMGLYVSSGYHRVIDSKMLQAQHPKWTGAFEATLGGSATAAFGTSLYDDGETRQYNAETNCTETMCSDPLVDYQSFRTSSYIGDPAAKHLPILLRMEWRESDPTPPAKMRAQFEHDAKVFFAGLSVPMLVATTGSPLQ